MAGESDNLFGRESFDLDTQMRCVIREINQRKYVYPRRVQAGKMSQQKADTELACMGAVLRSLRKLKKEGGGDES